MPVVINGSTGISGNDGTAAVPTIQGTDTNTGMFFPAADTIAFSEGGVEAMRLDASGNVGIGTSSPGANSLTVARGSGVGASVEICGNGTSPGSSGLTVLQSTASDAYVWNRANSFLSLGANNTERGRFTAAGDFQFNSGYGSVATAFGCRAWVNFNGTGVVAIRASGNVSSITDNGGSGDYTVNFTNAMPDANYSIVGMGVAVTGAQVITRETATPQTTTSCRIRSEQPGVTNADCQQVNVAVFR